ncbi:MAG: MATE family efflux transporter [Lachnospiraceae bacterium]|nr:MATE family efflux transporter [Lachnospiraceae bacterium]
MGIARKIRGDEFYSQMIKLVVPIVIQNILNAAISSADVVMLKFVGQSAISAVSLATQYANILFSVFFGLGTGVTMLCAQYYGKGDLKAIDIVQGIAMRFAIISSVAFALAALFIPELMMRVFTSDEELIKVGVEYIRWISISYLCMGIIEVYMSVLRSIGRVAICTILNVGAFFVNIGINSIFIFGLFNAPKIGAQGVAIATSATRLMELVGCIIISINSKDVKLAVKSIFIRNKVLFKDFVRLSLPALFNDVVWGLGFSMYSVIIGHLGSDAVAANSFVVVARNFGTILCFGIAGGGTILLGNILGENKLDLARIYAKRILKMTIIGGIVGGLMVVAAIPFIVVYAKNTLTATAIHYLKIMLLINGYYISGTAVNTVLIAGVFRAGGDSKFGLICDIIDMWVYAVPLGLISAFILKLPVLVVYFLLCTDEFVKWPWVFKRYKSEKWLKNITREDIY